MRVLLCNKFYRPIGGPENVLLHTMNELKALGHTPIPFAMAHPDNWESEYSEYFVSNVDYSTKHGKGIRRLLREATDLIYSPEARRNVQRLIADTKPDIAHAHNIYHQLSPSVLYALKKANIPTVLTLHDGKLLCPNVLFFTHGRVCEKCAGWKFHHAVLNKCVKESYASSLLCCIEGYLHRWFRMYEQVDLYIAPSRFFKQKLIEHHRLPEDRIEVLHTYGNTRNISPSYEPGGYGLFLGKVEAFKGVKTLVQACKAVPNLDVWIAGRGEFCDEGQRIAQAQGISNVKFVGFRSGHDVVRMLRECRFVLVPSEWYENCPMVVLEGFAAGKPVIASKIGGIPELIDHGVDGLLFEPGDAEGLASAMLELIENPDLASEMGRKGREKVEQRYSIEMYMKSLLGIYDKVLNSS